MAWHSSCITLAVCALCLPFAAGGCSLGAGDDSDDLPGSLASLQLFEGPLANLTPARQVTNYELASPSFCDYADSSFVMRLPAGTSIGFTPTGPFEFPVGTVLAQTLSYADPARKNSRRIVETRVLVRRASEWIGLPYVWNDEQSDATLEILGARIAVDRYLSEGTVRKQIHIVPNFNDCKRCHRIGDVMTPIAGGVRQLNRPLAGGSAERQLDRWQRDGVLRGLPRGEYTPRLSRWNDPSTGTLEQRARSYLESNCAHCHNPRGTARNSGLQLAAEIEEPGAFGVLKTPVAAGRGAGGLYFDILPGQPKLSIMLYRMSSLEGGIMMPEFGRTQVDEGGVALVSEWIASMLPMQQSSGSAGLVGVVTDVNPEEISTWAQEVIAQGDANRGAAVIQRQELNCLKCHSIAGKGANVGPDLAQIGSQAKVEHIVESILVPDRTIKEGFRAVTVQTQDGFVITGIQVRDDGPAIVLRDPVRGDTRVVKTNIAERSEGGSLMPANLAAALKRGEFLDLVGYLVELNSSDGKAQAMQTGSP